MGERRQVVDMSENTRYDELIGRSLKARLAIHVIQAAVEIIKFSHASSKLNGVGCHLFLIMKEVEELREQSVKLWNLLICILDGLELFEVPQAQNRMLNSLHFSKKEMMIEISLVFAASSSGDNE